MHADAVDIDDPHRMNPRLEAVWVDDPAADDGGFRDEWQACAEDEARFREKVDAAEAEINTLPVMRQERWRRMPLGLLTGRNRGACSSRPAASRAARSYGRAAVEREARRVLDVRVARRVPAALAGTLTLRVKPKTKI
jgi:hypothetical protein